MAQGPAIRRQMSPAPPQQAGQDVLDRAITVRLPDGAQKEYPIGTPLDIIQADFDAATARAQQPNIGLTPPVTPSAQDTPPPASPEELQKGFIRLLTKSGEFLGGLVPGAGWASTAARVGLPALIGAGGAALSGDDPGQEALEQLTIGAGGEGVAKLLPVAGLHAGMLVGGSKLSPRKQADAVQAFLRERTRRTPLTQAQNVASAATSGGGVRRRLANTATAVRDAITPNIPLGAGKRATKARKAAGQKVGELIDSSPATIQGDELLDTGADVARKQENTRHGADTIKRISKEESDFMANQIALRTGIDVDYIRQVLDDPTMQNIFATSPSMRYTMRQLQDLQQAAGEAGQAVTQARQAGTYVSPADAPITEQIPADFSRLVKAIQERNVPGLGPARGRFSDLMKMEEASNTLRLTGGINQLPIRAAGGYWLGQGANQLFGGEDGKVIEPTTAALIAGLLGPRILTGATSAAAKIGGKLPSGLRFLEASEEFKKTQRRRPGG